MNLFSVQSRVDLEEIERRREGLEDEVPVFVSGNDFDADVAVRSVVNVGDAHHGNQIADGGALVHRRGCGAVREEFEGDDRRVVVNVNL